MDAASVRGLSLDELTRELLQLRERVDALERRVEGGAQTIVADAPPEAAVPEAVIQAGKLGDAVPLIGRALLGVAGAYLLRALTELGAISHPVGVAAGFLYAAAWLYVAARTAPELKFATALNALTSAGVLGPLLWEALQRFHAISSWTAAGVITAFALTAVVLGWNKSGSVVPVIVTACAGLFALVLLIAMRDLLPFTVALLAVAAAVELAACFERETSSRPFLAFAVDAALVIDTYLLAASEGLPDGYVRVPALAILGCQIALLIIYLASTAARTLVRERPFTNFETLQTAAAFVIGLGGAFQLAKTSGTATASIGIFALIGGAACYVISFVFVGRGGRRDRNFHTYATFAILLVLVGSFLLFSGVALTAAWAAFVLACLWAGLREQRHILELHAAVVLLLAWLVSGVAMQPRTQFFGDPLAPVPALNEFIVIATAMVAYFAVVRGAGAREPSWDDRLAAVISAVALAWSLAGIVTHGLAVLSPDLAATWGTIVLAVTSAFLAVCGVEWKRPELRWMVFAFMAVGGYKLVTEDLRQKHTLALVVSLLLYGGMLIVLPRLLRSQK